MLYMILTYLDAIF